MCKISLETIRRANESLMRRRSFANGAAKMPARRLGDDIVVSTTYNGRVYEQRITQEEIRDAFEYALATVDEHHG